jgi:hypothetical protein
MENNMKNENSLDYKVMFEKAVSEVAALKLKDMKKTLKEMKSKLEDAESEMWRLRGIESRLQAERDSCNIAFESIRGYLYGHVHDGENQSALGVAVSEQMRIQCGYMSKTETQRVKAYRDEETNELIPITNLPFICGPKREALIAAEYIRKPNKISKAEKSDNVIQFTKHKGK